MLLLLKSFRRASKSPFASVFIIWSFRHSAQEALLSTLNTIRTGGTRGKLRAITPSKCKAQASRYPLKTREFTNDKVPNFGNCRNFDRHFRHEAAKESR